MRLLFGENKRFLERFGYHHSTCPLLWNLAKRPLLPFVSVDFVGHSHQNRHQLELSCVAPYQEGVGLEEAVRRQTLEEAGVEVSEVVYHSSQPWPDAQWHNREDVRRALIFAEYGKAQRTAAFKVNHMCEGVEKCQNFSSDFNVESGELAPMSVPGAFTFAHHLILIVGSSESTW